MLFRSGAFSAAREAKERSLVSFRSLGDQWVVALVTGSLGKVCFVTGDFAAARTFMREALRLGRDLGNKWAVPYALEGLADICAEEHQAGKAVRLYGAASAQREALALGFSPTEHAAYQKALNRLRELVSDETFEEEWNKGRSLGIQAAIELALETDAPRRPSARRKRPKSLPE